jgi:hypothetical protein
MKSANKKACITCRFNTWRAAVTISLMGLLGILWQWRNAVTERDAARQQWYRANMVAAGAALQVHNSMVARLSLDSAPPEFRQWE